MSLLASTLLFLSTVAAASIELPYVSSELFCPGTINSRNLVTTNGTELFISDAGPEYIYKVNVATGEDEAYCKLSDISVSYDNKTWYISFATGMFYNFQNNSLMLTSCILERENALSGSKETLSGYYTVDVTNNVVRCKNSGYVMGVFENGDILENNSYSGTTMTAKRLKYPNYSSTVATYSYYNVDEYSNELGIVNVSGDNYLINTEGIYPATGGFPRFLTYGNLVGANSNNFFMMRDSTVLKLSTSGSVVEQFSLDDVEVLDGGDIYNTKRNPLLITDDDDILFIDTDWDTVRKIQKRKIPTTGITLNKASVFLKTGTTETLIPAIAPSNATNQSILWTSSDNNVVTVKNGILTFASKGIATITATTVDGNYTAECNVACFDFEDNFVNYGFDENGIAWAISSDGKFEMVGTGTTESYTKTADVPWYSNRLAVTHIIIDSRITGIGSRSFYGFINAQIAEIPSSVTTIGDRAFENCDNMTIRGKSGTYAQTYAINNGIPFTDTEKTELKNISVDFAQTSTRWYFDISIEGYVGDAVVYIAIYGAKDQLLSLNAKKLEVEDITSITQTKNEQADYAKVFVWKPDSLQPISCSKIVDLN